MVIAVDFDGTCVTHEFPEIGKEIGAAPVLKCLTENGHQIVLNTMRSSQEGHRDVLKEAVDWFAKHDIPLYGVNENPNQKSWTTSPKVYADFYIDDCNIGTPLIEDEEPRPFIAWWSMSVQLLLRGLITREQWEYITNLFRNHSPDVGGRGFRKIEPH